MIEPAANIATSSNLTPVSTAPIRPRLNPQSFSPLVSFPRRSQSSVLLLLLPLSVSLGISRSVCLTVFSSVLGSRRRCRFEVREREIFAQLFARFLSVFCFVFPSRSFRSLGIRMITSCPKVFPSNGLRIRVSVGAPLSGSVLLQKTRALTMRLKDGRNPSPSFILSFLSPVVS